MRLYSRVRLLLVLLSLAAALGLPLLTYAPNRLLTGQGIALLDLLQGGSGLRWLALLPALPLLLAPWWRPGIWRERLVYLAALWLGAALWWLAGSEATLRAGDEDALARVSFGGGFWLLQLLLLLQLAEALQVLAGGLPRRVLLLLLAQLPLLWLLLSGRLDSLSLLREYHNNQDAFDDALLRHLQLVLFSVLPALLLGGALGVWAYRSARFARLLFPVLNVLQTIPSIALFGLLIGPLAWLGRQLPGLGIAGVGLAPALLALSLYALLPVVRGTLAGLQQVPPAVREAARGMGMTPWQIMLQVETPLALPVFLSGLRITAVQAVGLAAVAALIGAGGFGAIMFQGLSASALDQVLLGVLPVLLLALLVDVAFRLLIARLKGADDHA
ncbi:ABC transporter permease [Aquitalea palustris]|uniref:ABC transporter permease n=1 Tax=Aquitalea palustris TaxID=2480983 RepID=A0A454JIQ5_9NEIS|nr:ABC transporter permease [Aquitalea palustris]RMC97991.1 ABC transporter permease [Aquitalea palustris]